ncbi:XVIPCD domain-containing protein [Pseudoxanthomonas sacheonensis]|uniref:F0F1-type ATP synthase membrane subunit b/b n=1 Tax=Pseudoxanthomonas sacheonensis TaxID=443615 RepID=A0ABU1RNB6_9GAMM|nr:XVIPCD domain-containing protein [Pseudoxanthomonas sacheonensis]MDR6840273.1 F0F1-type ATP synthase membrane subunit b/b' [Pseudoxanthomonas sacheonensis]
MTKPTVTVGPELPSQDPRTLEEKILQVQQQRELLSTMRAQSVQSSDPQLSRQADALERQYYVRDVAGLADDVYESAAHKPSSQPGWLRASEHPELLRQAGVNWSDQQIRQYLQPDDSNFRAEIYLPDPRVFGPEAKPVVAYKGSNGAIVAHDSAGKEVIRESAAEDWLNNGRQGAGLESDYYDRAMRLANDLKRSPLGREFEIVGHSLGGGLASSASAITGIPAVTFNSSGLNPITAQRYADKQGLSVFDTDKTVTAYQVKGEVLTDGQAMVGRMDALQRMQMGAVATMAADVSRLPEARQLLTTQLGQVLPHSKQAQQDALGLIDYLAEHSGSRTLKQVPTAAGQVQPVLEAKMRDAHGNIVDRPKESTISEVAKDAGPLLNVLSGAVAGAYVGKKAGEGIATAGKVTDVALDTVGDGYRVGGKIAGQTVEAGAQTFGKISGLQVRGGGEVVAQVRVASGYLEAAVPTAQCVTQRWGNETSNALLRAASHLPFADKIAPGLRQEADRRDQATEAYCDLKTAQARGALDHAGRDANSIRQTAGQGAQLLEQAANQTGANLRKSTEQTGATIDRAFDQAGRGVRNLTGHAPTALAATGAGLGTVVAAEATYLGPGGLMNAWQTRAAIKQAPGAGNEATQRHLMTETVIPSLDARTQSLEHAAVKQLTQPAPTRESSGQIPAKDSQSVAPNPSPRSGALLNDPSHPDHSLFRDAARGIHAIDAKHNRVSDLRSDQLGGHLAVAAKEQGLRGIDHVVMSGDAKLTFAVQGRLDDPAHRRASVDTMQGLNTPLAQSTQQMAEVNARAEQIRNSAPAQQQEPEVVARAALRMA